MTRAEATEPGRPDSVQSLADRLKAERESRGISQSQAARELDVARTAYRLWELEAARPSPDRWRLVARWLGVSMTTLLLAEGLISEDEQTATDAASDRYEAATGQSADGETELSTGDFIDRSIDKGVVSEEEAAEFRAMFERIRSGLAEGEQS